MPATDQHTPVERADRVRQLLTIYGDPQASVAKLLCDQHPAQDPAFTVVAQDLSQRVLSYGELKEQSERFAAALAGMGVRPGDRVATLMGKSAELVIALVGIWRLGAVHVPLFTAFAPPAIALRLIGSSAKVVVCDEGQRSKLAAGQDIPAEAPWRVIVAGDATDQRDLNFSQLLARHVPDGAAAVLGGDAPMIQVFTSGTTGRPKGVVVPAVALASFHTYMEFGLGVRADDVFWNAADPGWAYGLYYGIIGPLCLGVPAILLQGGFSADSTIAVMSRLNVTNFTAAPTVYRSLRVSAVGAPRDLRLRCASAAGEPLTPEINQWSEAALGVAVHDHYGQTETGMLINNHHHPALATPLKPGAMGHSMPGWRAVVLYDDRDEEAPVGTLGRIAVDLDESPLAWFDGYLDEPAKSAEKFTADKRWYLTGDSGKIDEDGYFHFLSRDDDVIIMAGYRIGPFDVESVLLSHPDVAEAAVIAAPDDLRGEVLEAYVVLQTGHVGTPNLAEELQRLVKTKFAAHAYPRRVHFIPQLPKTPSGKIQRFVLRKQRRGEFERARLEHQASGVE